MTLRINYKLLTLVFGVALALSFATVIGRVFAQTDDGSVSSDYNAGDYTGLQAQVGASAPGDYSNTQYANENPGTTDNGDLVPLVSPNDGCNDSEIIPEETTGGGASGDRGLGKGISPFISSVNDRQTDENGIDVTDFPSVVAAKAAASQVGGIGALINFITQSVLSNTLPRPTNPFSNRFGLGGGLIYQLFGQY